MIYFYSGTPGSGKSLHAAKDIISKLRRGQNVICNFKINMDIVEKGIFHNHKVGLYLCADIWKTPDFLIQYAKIHHKIGVEGQTLIVVDECQRYWPSRNDRLTPEQIKKWEDFFSLHRHYGYNLILISQNDRMIARYLRGLLEYEVKHRKANNFGMGRLIPFPLFAAVSYWYGVKERLDCEFFTFSKKYSGLYDSYKTFEQAEKESAKDCRGGGVRDSGGDFSAALRG